MGGFENQPPVVLEDHGELAVPVGGQHVAPRPGQLRNLIEVVHLPMMSPGGRRSRGGFDVDARASWGSSGNYHVGPYGATVWAGFPSGPGGYNWHDLATSRSVFIRAWGTVCRRTVTPAPSKPLASSATASRPGVARASGPSATWPSQTARRM